MPVPFAEGSANPLVVKPDYYYCFLLNFSKAEMKSVFQMAKISLQPQSVGEKIIMNFINRNVYDNDYLMEVFSREPLRELTMREIMGLNE